MAQYILAYLLSVCTIRARKPIEEREWLDENAQPALVAHVFIKPLGIVECYTQNDIYHAKSVCDAKLCSKQQHRYYASQYHTDRSGVSFQHRISELQDPCDCEAAQR